MQKRWMKVSLAAAAVLGAAGMVRAELMAEPIPADLIQQVAPIAVQLLQAQIPNPPVKVEPQVEKAIGYHVQQLVGAVVVPDKNLTSKAIEETREKSVPAGILLTRALSLEEKEQVIGGDKLAVADFQGQLKLPIFFLSVKADGENRVLEVYGKDGKPLASAPLKKEEGDKPSQVAMKFTNINLEKKRLDATVTLSGYQSTLKLGYIDLQ